MSERINPYKRFVGSFIPEWLEEREDVSDGAKIVYARLARYAGKDGRAYPKQETLAAATGKPLRTLKRCLKELCDYGLLESKQRGLGMPNEYYFLHHKIMNDAMALPEVPPVARLEVPPVAQAYKENHIKENQINIEREREQFTEVMRYYRAKVNNRWEVSTNGKYRKRLSDLIHQGRAISDIKKVIDHRFAELENGLPQYLVEPDNIFKHDLFLKTLNAANFKPAQKPKAVNGKNSGIQLAGEEDFKDKPSGWENYGI